MAELTFAPFVAFLLCSWIFVLCQGTLELNVKAGEDATLPCLGHTGVEITYIEWRRSDLTEDHDYVFLFKDGNSKVKNQHEYFHGRANVSDSNRKNGDASLILKNVNIDDTGTYKCQIKEGNRGQPKLINTIKLTVTGLTAGHKEGGDKEGGDKEGGDEEGGGKERNVGLKVDLSVVLLLAVAVAVGGFMF